MAERYKDGRLTLQGMRDVLAEGGSVIYQGRMIVSEADLPKASELASSPAERDALQGELNAKLAELQKQIEALQASAPTGPGDAGAPSKAGPQGATGDSAEPQTEEPNAAAQAKK